MRKLFISIVVVALCASPLFAEDAANRTRVGVFKRTDLLVAFYKSPAWLSHLTGLIQQREEAKARGDAEKVKEIEAQGAREQEHAHKQLVGEARLDNIMKHMKEQLPGIAREAGVSLIVERPLYSSADVELVDVTELLTESLSSDPGT